MYTLFIIVNSACMTTVTLVVVTCYIYICDRYSKTRLQRISGDTSKNFIVVVIRYIDIAKFVILYNEFVLHKENKSETMNWC